jgi:hypothetical protein
MVGANPRSTVRPLQYGSYGDLLHDPPRIAVTSRQEAKHKTIEKWIFYGCHVMQRVPVSGA